MEQTYLMIKPEILAGERQYVGEILAAVNRAGFRILELRTFRLDRRTAERFYAEHKGKGFFADLIAYITSGPVVAVRLERADAVRRLRELIGATDPAAAVCGSIRFLYGSSLQRNAVHGSATPEDARRELDIVFARPRGGRSGRGARLDSGRGRV